MGKRITPRSSVFVSVSAIGKVGLGYAMAMYNPDISIQFSSQAQGSTTLQSLACTAFNCNKDDRLGLLKRFSEYLREQQSG